MNPLNIFQMMKNGSPQQFLQQMMGNNQIMRNPLMKNTIEMAQKGDMQGIEQMARNLCKEKGLNADDVINQIKSKFNN
jgi:formate dehydrogenase maturation protein FdhE